MPKGIPRSGVRMYGNRAVPVSGNKMRTLKQQREMQSGITFMEGPVTGPVEDKHQNETDAQIEKRLSERFEVLEEMTWDACKGISRAVIVSGPAGLGKSYVVEKVLEKYDPEGSKSIIRKGFTRATGLFKSCAKYQHKGNVQVYDDCDSVFMDGDALSLLKTACDTTERRRMYWGSETRMLDDETGEKLLPTFDFNGSIIFITNFDMDEACRQRHSLTPHFNALMSRAHYIDLKIKTKRDYLVQIHRVVNAGMLRDRGLDKKQETVVMDYTEENIDKLREISLRSVIKIGDCLKAHPTKWKQFANVTVLRNG